MSRDLGDITFPSTLQVKKQEMLDPRMGVDKIEDLTAEGTFPSDGDTIYMKEGMPVYVKEDKGIYMLIDIKNINSLEKGWHKLNPSAKEYLTYISGYAVNKEEATIDGQNGINLIGTNGIDVKLDEQYTQLPSNVPYRTIKIDGRGIKSEILDDNGKILPSLIPQYMYGGLMYGGTIENRSSNSLLAPDDIYIKPTSSYKNKHNINYEIEEIKVTEENFLASGHEGEYFIVAKPNASDLITFRESFSWGELYFEVGDWFISNGNIWAKIDNTESVKSVAEMTGNISAESLARILSSDIAKNNKLATNTELTSINTKLTSINAEFTSVQESISNVQESISDINDIRDKADIGASAVRKVKINGKTESPNNNGVVDLGVISGGDGTPNALFCAGTITGALGISVNNNYHAKVQVNEVFEKKYGYTPEWLDVEMEDGNWGKAAVLEPGEYKLICKGTYNIPGSAIPLFVPITLRINGNLSGWGDIFSRGFIETTREGKGFSGILQAEPTSNIGYLDFLTDMTREEILRGTYVIYLSIKEAGRYEFSGYTSTISNDPNNYIIDEISLGIKTIDVALVRTKDPSLVDTIRQIQALDHQGCYFIMGNFLGTESILGLGATTGDWIVAQGPSWVKVTTADRTIAGITGNVSAEDLAGKLSGILNNNLSLATKAEVVLIGNEDDSKDADTYYGLKKYIETGKTALFCAGRIIGVGTQGYSYPQAQVEINDAFKAKYGDNKLSHTSVELVNKRTSYGDSIRQLVASEHEGCYFVMGIYEDNDNILGLNASYGDWVISQGNAWVKISTVRSNIAGFTSDVTDGQLANKLSQRSETNTTPLARKDELDDFIKGVKVNGEAVDTDENGVVDITLDAVQAVKINGEIKRPTEGIVDLGNIEGGEVYISTLIYKATSKVENTRYPWNDSTFGVPIINHEFSANTGVIYFRGMITTIGQYAFYGCRLKSITIPDSVTTIGEKVFEYCSSLTSVTIGNSVTTIGDYAFEYCSGLTSVTIPDSVRSIGNSVFAGCSRLASVYCKATTPPTGGTGIFSSNASGRKIYVPMESVEAYKSSEGWSEYADDIVGYNYNVGLFKTINGESIVGEGDISIESGIDTMVRISWSSLVNARNNEELVPGTYYRITDYVTTTVQENTGSAGNLFDVIVLALDKHTLSEKAYAIQSERDTDGYFANNKLSAWKLWYCLDNDTTRFAWADETNGTGVIYRMIDEFENDCPYDFKNILFKRNINTSNGYPEISEDAPEKWVYTFCGRSTHYDNGEYSDLNDGSLESPYGHQSDEQTSTFHHNIIKPWIVYYDGDNEDYIKCGIAYLSNNVFLGYWEELNSRLEEEYPYYYAECCYNNILGHNCYNNTFGIRCRNNIIDNDCWDNRFLKDCNYNKLGIGCNTNSFGEYSSNNSLDDNCTSNSFGNLCNFNSFGKFCNHNSFSNNCSFNSLGSYCSRNSFGVGPSFEYNSLASGIYNLHLSNDEQGNGVITCVQNYHIAKGVNKTYAASLVINAERGRNYETTIARNSNGEVVELCLADFPSLIITTLNTPV